MAVTTAPADTPTARLFSASRRVLDCFVILSCLPKSERCPFLARDQRLPFPACSSRYSDARQERAVIVSVGFLSGLVAKQAPSVTNRFLTSCAWQNPFNAEVLESEP